VDGTGDGRGAVTAAGLLCGSCGTELPPDSRFCNKCGAPVAQVSRSAEYKQVTVLFADVVHSMDIAAAVGAELREIMADITDRSATVVQRYCGTVNQFTRDGIMAVFGAPVALEDHAVLACLAGLAIQEEAKQLAVDVQHRDGVDLWLRVGLNSGQVIAGEIGSGSYGYTAIGEQVGMAQRMESVAPPGGVMLSASTARLVERVAALGELELVRIKGADEPVPAHRLVGVRQDRTVRRAESNLVGRQWEMSAVEGLLDRAIDGHGAVVGVVGPAGIGKSRLVREVSTCSPPSVSRTPRRFPSTPSLISCVQPPARESPAVYVVEDAHWIDAISESMLADFLAVIPQTPSLVIVTYRPEYEGALSRVHGAQTVALAR
jgi:adenylate cyclase